VALPLLKKKPLPLVKMAAGVERRWGIETLLKQPKLIMRMLMILEMILIMGMQMILIKIMLLEIQMILDWKGKRSV